jgi:phospholipid/cholesterol/gamma-HCH transport system substrate-binding protein
MDLKITTEFKVGLTVIIATLILIFGIIWGKGFQLKTDKYHISIQFDNIGGMVIGDPVTVNGVKEGKVLDIGWKDRMVVCLIELNDRIQLYEDATFTIISAELLAGMKIEIFPGKSSNHINLSQQPFTGKYGGRIVDVGLVIGDLAEDMSALSFRLDSTIAMINTMLRGGNLQKDLSASLANLTRLTAELNKLPNQLNSSMIGLDETLTRFRKLVDDNGAGIHSTLSNLDLVTAKLDTVSSSLKVVMGKIESQEGTLGKMVYDPSLYNNLSKTLMTIDSLAKKIKDEGLDIDLF